MRTTRVAALILCSLVIACRGDAPTHPVQVPSYNEPSGTNALVAEVPASPCVVCAVGPLTFERQSGKPVTENIAFTVVAGSFVVDVDDLGSQGADGQVTLNGVTLLAPRIGGLDEPRHFQGTIQLPSQNSLTVRLVGKPGSVLRVAIWRFVPVTLDAVTLAPGTPLQIDGPIVPFNSTITNHTQVPFTGIWIQGWIEQGAARRAGGGQLVYCLAAFGLLPPGTCIRTGDGIFASNSNQVAGIGTLVPGNATAVIEVRQLFLSGHVVLDSQSVPVVLSAAPGSVLGVTVNPAAVLLTPGQNAQLTANVQVTGGAATTVTWSTSSAVNAVVNSLGLITAVSPGSAAIWATSTADVSKNAAALVRVYNPLAPLPFQFSVTAPAAPTTVHRDAGATTVLLVAQAVGPSPIFNPFSGFVEFWGRSSGGAWRLLGPATSTILSDNLVTRTFTYSMTWDPDNVTAPFASPSTTVIEIVAVGTGGIPILSAPNSQVTVVVP